MNSTPPTYPRRLASGSVAEVEIGTGRVVYIVPAPHPLTAQEVDAMAAHYEEELAHREAGSGAGRGTIEEYAGEAWAEVEAAAAWAEVEAAQELNDWLTALDCGGDCGV